MGMEEQLSPHWAPLGHGGGHAPRTRVALSSSREVKVREFQVPK